MPRLTMFGLWWTHSSATPTALSPKIAKSLSISEIRALKRGSGGAAPVAIAEGPEQAARRSPA